MERAWELFIKTFLLLIFGPVLIFYLIHLLAALLGVVAAFLLSLLPVFLVGALVVGVLVGLFWVHSRVRKHDSLRSDNGNLRGALLGNVAVRRPRGKKRKGDDDD